MNIALKILVQLSIVFIPAYFIFRLDPSMLIVAVVNHLANIDFAKILLFFGSIVIFYIIYKRTESAALSVWESDNGYTILTCKKCGLFGTPHTILWLWSTVLYVSFSDDKGENACAWLNMGFRSNRVEGVVLDRNCASSAESVGSFRPR